MMTFPVKGYCTCHTEDITIVAHIFQSWHVHVTLMKLHPWHVYFTHMTRIFHTHDTYISDSWYFYSTLIARIFHTRGTNVSLIARIFHS